MIELPEALTLTRQMNEALSAQRIAAVTIAEKRPKWMFLNLTPEQYTTKLVGVRVNEVASEGKWIFTKLDTREIFLLGEMFGRIRYHQSEEPLPKKHHMLLTFDDESRLSITIQMWGCTQVLTPQEVKNHPCAGNRGPSPIDKRFTPKLFRSILDTYGKHENKPIKAFLTHEGNVSGIGNGYLQDILFRARLSPKRKVADIGQNEQQNLYHAIVETMNQAIELAGRDTEPDLYGNPGRYVPILDKRAKGEPCPECGTPIAKIAYLGGSCYLCPVCQS